jgi:hypothetical protein
MFSGRHRILRAPELVKAAHPDGLRVGRSRQSTGALKGPFKDREPPVALETKEKELAALVGAEGEGEALLSQPPAELPRGAELQG